MADSKTFTNVTPALFECIKRTSAQQHGTVYDPANGNQGTATTHVPVVGTIVLEFLFDPAAETLTYTVKEKPGIVTDGEIWGGIQSTIDSCSGSQPS